MRFWLLPLAILMLASSAGAAAVDASAPEAVSVTIYRNPHRRAGPIDLDELGGFALVTETRTVHLPAGESKLRFQGVVDGIQPESAIITGLPDGVIEKNHDAALISPEALIKAAVDSQITLVRTNPKTGEVKRIRATIRSANAQGVIFETEEGVEALQCSGLPETMSFERVPAGLTSTPTLSVLTRADQPFAGKITLSYLATNFDWAANYVARVNRDGRTLNLSGWITLANGNDASLPAASALVVAGRLNLVEPAEDLPTASPVPVAHCWSLPAPPPAARVTAFTAATEVGEVIVTAEKRVTAEPLGDLKLYRIPQTTTVAAHQVKQVGLLEQFNVPFWSTHFARLFVEGEMDDQPAYLALQTKNSRTNHLGLPLPSGRVALFGGAGGELLIGESSIRDIAVDEDTALWTGSTPDIRVHQTPLSYTAQSPELLSLSRELTLAFRRGETLEEVEITNARAEPIPFELSLYLDEDSHVTAADQPMGTKDGRPIFRLTLPANGSVKVRYAVAQ
jgi:hypothetical protein